MTDDGTCMSSVFPVGHDYPDHFPGLTPDFTGARFVLLTMVTKRCIPVPVIRALWVTSTSDAEEWLRIDSQLHAVIVLCPDGSCGHMTLHFDGSVGFRKALGLTAPGSFR
jgi:hypothetical protein